MSTGCKFRRQPTRRTWRRIRPSAIHALPDARRRRRYLYRRPADELQHPRWRRRHRARRHCRALSRAVVDVPSCRAAVHVPRRAGRATGGRAVSTLLVHVKRPCGGRSLSASATGAKPQRAGSVFRRDEDSPAPSHLLLHRQHRQPALRRIPRQLRRIVSPLRKILECHPALQPRAVHCRSQAFPLPQPPYWRSKSAKVLQQWPFPLREQHSPQ